MSNAFAKECPECGADVPEDICFEGGICEDCYEAEVLGYNPRDDDEKFHKGQL